MLKIYTLNVLKDNFVYVIANSNNQSVVVDPGDAKPVENFLDERQLKLIAILCTHHHADHVNGVASLVNRYNCVVYGSRYDMKRLPVKTQPLDEGVDIELLGESLRVLEVPGHTLGQIAFYFPSNESLFVGDTLFSGGCGRLFEGTAEMMYSSLAKIKALPPSTKIYFGHEYTLRNLEFVKTHKAAPTAALKHFYNQVQKKIDCGQPSSPTLLADELTINPFLSARSVEEFSYWRALRDHW